jgi:diguanylate cyclase (GGDEF)-like protein
LQQAITAAQESDSSVALLLLDLDHFKHVNDALGHHAGDRLLTQVSARLKTLVRAADTIARLGGDEFAVLVPGAKVASATWAARKLLSAFAAPITLAEGEVQTAASIGIALFPENGSDAAALLRHADVAMYAAKRTGGGFAQYSARQDQQSVDRLTLMNELRQALKSNELVLHYQPKVDLRTGKVVGAEALVRWPHPTRGLLPPDQFIPIAEQTGVVALLTSWVVEAAVAQCRIWQESQLPLSVAVNLSMRTLHDPQLPRQIASLLRTHALEPGLVTLEITESALMEDQAGVRQALETLGTMGVKLSIDDFGTGLSSLGQLSRLAVQELKIDKSFVMEMEKRPSDAVIVRSIIEMGHTLGLTVVAEGIENRHMWEVLAHAGCDVAQGYYMSKPLPAAAFARWVLTSPFGVTRFVR